MKAALKVRKCHIELVKKRHELCRGPGGLFLRYDHNFAIERTHVKARDDVVTWEGGKETKTRQCANMTRLRKRVPQQQTISNQTRIPKPQTLHRTCATPTQIQTMLGNLRSRHNAKRNRLDDDLFIPHRR
jgi:hypothetical protein